MEAKSTHVSFKDLRNLVNLINKSLGDFCDEFRYERKELASRSKASSSGILFKYEDDSRDWAINEGGGTEIQYHLFYRNDMVGYGLGFNTQYVPFANKMSPVEYMAPFAQGYIQIKNSELVLELKEQNFCFQNDDEDELSNLQDNQYHFFGNVIHIQNNTIPLSLYEEMIEHIKGNLFDLYCVIFEKRNEIINNKNRNMEEMKKYTDLLKSNKNLILTGAPGTGKTYLAKQIAETINAEICFTQFHPSYDYTDFVEGLRPTRPDEDGNIGFELKDGVFKEFCKKALINRTSNFNEIYDQFIDDISQNDVKFETPVKKKNFSVEVNSKKSCYVIPNTDKATKMPITKEMIRDYIENGNIRDWKPYTTAIGDYIKQNYKIDTKDISDRNRPFVFIIDEINRGEISKIFGELFFSIDPSYRGKKGAVKTQYFNMQEDKNEVFYVPENVYIIGTMNDIDRSVESFDFAMRRRFVWEEITAEQSAENMNLPDEIKVKMAKLNLEISKTEGLGTSYHIGGAYFLDKDGKPRTDYDFIWKLRLEPLLKEYLRGMSDARTKLDDLREAYENKG